MAPLACLSCAGPLGPDDVCAACGLDGALPARVHRAAKALASRAARHAGAGAWQEAYDTAAASLRLASRDNDLAAFVLLVAAMAGARGSVREVPRPRADRLPALPAAPGEVVALAAELRALGAAIDRDPTSADRRLHAILARHPGLLPVAGPPGGASPPGGSSVRAPRLPAPAALAATLALATVAGVAGALTLLGAWRGLRGRRGRARGAGGGADPAGAGQETRAPGPLRSAHPRGSRGRRSHG